jgi:hypothetical protein
MELSIFANFATEPFATHFLIRITQLLPDLRVRLVFEGLLERILPTAAHNNVILELLSSVVADPLVRQYIHEMHHLPAFVQLLFESNISDSSTKVFRALLDPNDLVHLNSIQQVLFNLNMPNQLVTKLNESHITDEIVQNVAICLGDCLQYFPVAELGFALDPLFTLLIERPRTQTALLYFWEILALSNPELFPNDDYFFSMPTDHFIVLYLSYLSYDCHRRSSLDIGTFHDLSVHSFSLLLAVGIQRRQYIKQAEFLALSPEVEVHRQLANANCFVCGKSKIPRNALIHFSGSFFLESASLVNPYFGNSRGVGTFFPQTFIAWGLNFFCAVNKGRLIHGKVAWLIGKPWMVFEVSPDDAHAQQLSMYGRTSVVIDENRRWREKVETLERKHNDLLDKYRHLEMELIDVRCQQFVPR